MLTNTQSRMSWYEEDHKFRKDICTLAKKIGNRISKPATVEKILDHVRDSDCRCLGRIKRLSRDYRISKNEDISNDYPVHAVAEKVREAIEEGDLFVEENVAAELVDYVPENPALQQMIEEHIKSRLQNSNCHHIKKRGQSMIKQGLYKVANALNVPLDDLIKIDKIYELEEMIAQYSKIAAAEDTGDLYSGAIVRSDSVKFSNGPSEAAGGNSSRSDLAFYGMTVFVAAAAGAGLTALAIKKNLI